MRDAEFVLRYFTFKDDWESFSSRIKSGLDKYLIENQRLGKKKLDILKSEFTRTVRAVHAAFGEHAFRRYQPEKDQWRRQVLASKLLSKAR